MKSTKKIVAIVGSYRRGSIIDSAVCLILSAAAECGAETSKVYLTDAEIEFCTNCRSCTQTPGVTRGRCVIEDDMNGILDQIEQSHALVLASPVNFGDITAITKRFQERLVRYAYWPWGKMAPVLRNKSKSKKAVLVTSSAAPAWLGRTLMRSVGTLKRMGDVLGARPIGTLYVGLAATQDGRLPQSAAKKARTLGRKLAS